VTSCRAFFTFILPPPPISLPLTAAGQTAAAALAPADWALEPPQKLCFAKNIFVCPFVVHFYVFPALFDTGMFSKRIFEGVQGRDI
jgi:hypothetical protein